MTTWGPGAPVSPADLIKAESQLGVSFPEDYREFMMLGGLRSGNDAPRGLWPLADVVSLNGSMPVFRWYQGLVGIGNEGFMVYAFDFRSGPPKVVSLGLSSSNWSDVNLEAETFEAWLNQSL